MAETSHEDVPKLGATYRAVDEHRAPSYPPITVRVGEQVTYLPRRSPWPSYCIVVKQNGHAGWMPSRFLAISGNQARVKVEYCTRELRVNFNDEVVVRDLDEVGGWAWCESARGSGWVPQSVLGFA